MKKLPVILVVEEIAQTAKLVELTLSKSLECNILTARSGKEALDIAYKHHPDIILLDIALPEMDGFAVCKAINSQPGFEDIPVIFLAGKVNNQDIVMGLNIGAVDFVTKPFYPKELVARVQIHLKIRAQQQLISQQNQRNRELLQVLCHDLVNQVASLSGLFSLSKDEPQILLDHQALLEESVQNMAAMISLVREFKEIDDGKTKINLIPINLNEAIESSLRILTHQLKDKKITTTVSISEEMVVLAEKTSFINSVINNLVTNAIKFSNPGSTITINADDLDEEHVALTISDEGIGIPPGILNDLFRMNASTSRVGTNGETGTGYGMPLVEKFVTHYGGTISVKSVEKKVDEEAHGTEIMLTLKKA